MSTNIQTSASSISNTNFITNTSLIKNTSLAKNIIINDNNESKIVYKLNINIFNNYYC